MAQALPGLPHQLCQFDYLREAARPIYEADRHAKKGLKKRVRGVRGIERQAEARGDPEAEAIRSYCGAVRSALSDDGRPPLDASGLQLHERLTAISPGLGHAGKKGLPRELERLKGLVDRGLTATASLGPSIRTAFGWVHQAAHLPGSEGAEGAGRVKRRLSGLLGAMASHRHRVGQPGAAVGHFLRVTRSYWPGLFFCYAVAALPRTDNDLGHLFGSHRYHERRASGRKGASPALVLRGAARLLAAAATRQRRYAAKGLAEVNRAEWKRLRGELESRRQRRAERTRFRRDPQAFLSQLEDLLLQSALPT